MVDQTLFPVVAAWCWIARDSSPSRRSRLFSMSSESEEDPMNNQPGSGGISLKGFVAASHGTESSSYVSALESFDRLEQMQELKALGHERTGIHPGAHVLDVGCGFGLEKLRLARLAAPGGVVAGCDLSSDFLAEARRRATAAVVDVNFQQAHVEALPYP